MKNRLLMIFIKNPLPGRVKTRLAETLGNEKALAVYRLLLSHTLSITNELTNCDKAVFYSDFTEDDGWKAGSYMQFVQEGTDLGQRMEKAFAKGFEMSYQNIIIVGSDCMELDPATITRAFDALDGSDLVIGPAHDGGYYLLGMKTLHKELFVNKDWSTPAVLRQTLASAADHRLTWSMLPILHDIDTEQDLAYFYKTQNHVGSDRRDQEIS